MSTRDRVGVTRAVTSPTLDLPQIQRDRTAQAVDAAILRDAVLLAGVKDSEGKVTDGIAFSGGQARELAHNLGRKPSGFIIVDTQTAGAPAIYRDPVGLSTGLDPKQFIRLVNGSPGTTYTVKVLVF